MRNARSTPRLRSGRNSSRLSGFFIRIGRDGRYLEATGSGNPCDSIWVADFRKAYQRQAMQGGYVETSAVPLTEEKYRRLICYLWSLCRDIPTVLGVLILLRDLLCAQYMWLSSQRGHDTGKLGLGDFVDPENPSKSFAGFPLPAPALWPAGYTGPVLCVAERGTKTSRISRAPEVLLRPNPSEPEFCFVRTLAIYMAIASHPSAPDGSAISDYLFRPLRPDRHGFREAPLSGSALGARIRMHLMMASVYEGETNHSFRRGSLQHAAGQGASLDTLHAQSQIRSADVLRRYLDETRHHGPSPEARPGGMRVPVTFRWAPRWLAVTVAVVRPRG